MSLAIKLQTASAEYQKLDLDLSNVVEARQRLEAQLSENELVKKEFSTLTSENIIYKQIGPALVKQDPAEAKAHVDTRLDFIRSEIKRVEEQLKNVGAAAEKKKVEIVNIQATIQQQAQQGAAEAS
ncbi:Prefoldin beta-like protein [Fistulina hepatica ATCC 64428]|uniref:Prefoldin beta-like protein n=1 Tax=Fistulina hepatica ATCC 64428 TaxID=1128425 RepID=A0A0D7AHE7_9AGAR|nr:Prefoldin beta-like protein [Fistulina hepatica ATCC 64428]